MDIESNCVELRIDGVDSGPCISTCSSRAAAITRPSWRHPRSSRAAAHRYPLQRGAGAEGRSRPVRFDLPRRRAGPLERRRRRRRSTGSSRSRRWPRSRWRRSRIGLIATASTTYTEPYNLARQFCSLDHISRGRIGWNIVTTWSPQAGGNFGGIGQVSHADRYERAEEYMTVVKGLWDSWADDAVLDDRAGGRYADPQRVRPINHDGQALPGDGSAEPAALAAGPAGVRAGWLVGYRPPLCGAPCRGGVHGSPRKGDGESLLRRSKVADCRRRARSPPRC